MVIYVNKKTTGPARGFQLKQKNTSPGFFRLYKSAERQPFFWNQAPFNVSRQMMSSSFSVNKWHWTIDIDWAYIQVAYWISPHMFDGMEWLPVQYIFKTRRWYISVFLPKGENVLLHLQLIVHPAAAKRQWCYSVRLATRITKKEKSQIKLIL